MKIAIFLAGALRFLDKCHTTFKNLFPGHEVDFFAHSWASNQYSEQQLIDMVEPKAWIYEKPKETFNIDYDKLNSKFIRRRDSIYINRAFSHYYSISQIAKFDIASYDYVLRIRSDQYFTSDLLHLFDYVGNKLLMNYSGVGFTADAQLKQSHVRWQGIHGNNLDPCSINRQTTYIGDCCFFARPQVFLNFAIGILDFFQDSENNRAHEGFASWQSENQVREWLWYKDIPYRHVSFPYLLFRNHHRIFEPGDEYPSVTDPFVLQFIKNNPINEVIHSTRNNPHLFGRAL